MRVPLLSGSFSSYTLKSTGDVTPPRSPSHPFLIRHPQMSQSGIYNSRTTATKTFETALVSNLFIAGAYIVGFILVRRCVPLIYEPRSSSVFGAEKQQELSPRPLGWLTSILNADYTKIKDINGLDCYFFVRFLRVMVRIMLPIWVLSWAVLFPLTSIDSEVASHAGLEKFMFGNVAANRQSRYIGHLILTWISTIWVWWNINHEMVHYVDVRQQYLIGSSHSSTAQARTVLVTSIPLDYRSESALTRLFGHLPGGVRKVWVNRNIKDIIDLYDRRLKACDMLESAGTALLNKAVKRNHKKQESSSNGDNKESGSAGDIEAARDTLMEQLVPRQEWPSHRLPLFSWLPFALPFVGRKVDTIEWARDQVQKLNAQLDCERQILASNISQTTALEADTSGPTQSIGASKGPKYPPLNGAFILFNKQIAAHMAAQCLTHHEPYRMSASLKYIEVAPDDVIWDNLTRNPYGRRVRHALSWAVTIALIVLWSIPLAFIGFVSNIHSVCGTYRWLAWLCKAPTIVIDIVQGVVPAKMLAMLLKLVAIILRSLARWEGIPHRTGVELTLMDRFFMFQVINGFLVVTFSSGIIASLPGLVNHPTAVPTLLAQNLPKSSIFFLTFVMHQGLSETGSGFLQIVPFMMYYIKIILLASTPRSVLKIKYSPRTSEWGTLFPAITQLVVITFGYSIISPIINGLALATFLLFYLLYKYLFTWVNNQPHSSDTGGLFFPKAIQHIFVGLYVQQICLCALFFLAQNEHGVPSASPEGGLLVLLVVLTAFFHNIIRNSYGPLIKDLPLSLAEQAYSGAEPKAPPSADAPGSENANVIDYADVSVALSDQPADSADDSSVKHGQDKPPAAIPSLLAELIRREGPTDFRHPAAVEAQRIIRLPKDPLGLVHEIERDLKAHDILYSSADAEMDNKGHVYEKVAPRDVHGSPKEESQA